MPSRYPQWKLTLRDVIAYCYDMELESHPEEILRHVLVYMQEEWPGPYTLEWDKSAYIDKIILKFKSSSDETMWLLRYS